MFHPQSICATSEDVKMAKAVQTSGPPSPVVPLRSKGENRARTHDNFILPLFPAQGIS